MGKLFWVYTQWCGRWPSTGGDEYGRRTVVLPWPWPHETDEDRAPLHWAVCAVVLPWWATADALRPEYRRWISWERGLQAHLRGVPDAATDEQLDAAFDDYVARAGTVPGAPW